MKHVLCCQAWSYYCFKANMQRLCIKSIICKPWRKLWLSSLCVMEQYHRALNVLRQRFQRCVSNDSTLGTSPHSPSLRPLLHISTSTFVYITSATNYSSTVEHNMWIEQVFQPSRGGVCYAQEHLNFHQI